jgi:hypothetical protein
MSGPFVLLAGKPCILLRSWSAMRWGSRSRRFLPAAALLFSVCFSLAAQSSAPRIVYRSRAYQRLGASHEQWWEMDLTTGQKAPMSDANAAQKRSTCLGAGQRISRFEKSSAVLSASGRELAEISVHEPFDRSPLRIDRAMVARWLTDRMDNRPRSGAARKDSCLGFAPGFAQRRQPQPTDSDLRDIQRI